MRAGADIDSTLRHVNDGHHLLQRSLPKTRNPYDLPRATYITSFLRDDENPYRDSLICEYTRVNDLNAAQTTPTQTGDGDGHARNIYERPYHAAELVDSLLANVTIAGWTSVSSDELILKELLHTYFLHEFPFFAFFHRDYFLEDMKANRHKFCSSLLVNAVLAAGCHGYTRLFNRAEFWNPTNLGYRFLAEARRLWELEAGKSSVTTVQAGLIISITCNIDGIDKIGWSYLHQAVDMARNMQLFKSSVALKDLKARAVRSITAWSLFSWQAMACFQFFRTPLLKEPPEWALSDPSTDASWYGETWVKYPLSEELLSTNHSHVFYSIAQFRVILNEIANQSFGHSGSRKGLSLEETYKYSLRLEEWFQNLAEPLSAKNVVLPSQLKLHMHYYIVIINIFGAHAVATAERFIFHTSKTPRQIISEALACLQTVTYIYYYRHGFKTYDPAMLQFLTFLSFRSLAELKSCENPNISRTLRSTLLLSAKGLQEQGRNYYLGEVMSRIIRDEAACFDPTLVVHSADTEDEEEDTAVILQRIHSQWPVGSISIADDPDKQRIENLINNIADMDLEEDTELSEEDV